MGRFDSLTQLEHSPAEEKDRKPASPQVDKQTSPLTSSSSSPQVDKSASGQSNLAASPQVHKSTSGQTSTSRPEKAERYTTRLQPSLIKQVKRYAFEHDREVYEVLKEAIDLYLEQKK